MAKPLKYSFMTFSTPALSLEQVLDISAHHDDTDCEFATQYLGL